MVAGLVNSEIISEVLLQLYAVPKESDFFEHILSILEENISFSISSYGVTRLESKSFNEKTVRDSQGVCRDSVQDIERLAQLHPFMKHYLKNDVGPVLCTTDLMSEEEWKQTLVYNELHKKCGVVHDASIRFYSGDQCISFSFSDTVPLDPGSRRFLNLIAPHLSQAYRSYQVQQAGFMGDLPRGMILLSAEGSIIECSAEDAGLLKKYFPAKKTFSGKTLPETVARWFRHETGQDSVFQKLVARRDEGILMLKLVRISGGHLILFEESKFADPITVYMEMGLTLREAEVLRWVSQGKQNSDVAVILDICTATVRKHMEHILKKLHCETRGAAAQMGLRTVREKSSGVFPAKCLFCTKSTCTSC